MRQVTGGAAMTSTIIKDKEASPPTFVLQGIPAARDSERPFPSGRLLGTYRPNAAQSESPIVKTGSV
jgi:hypothetical protein